MKAWTEQEIDQAYDMRERGFTHGEIANALCRSLSSVSHKLSGNRPWEDDEVQQMREMVDAGLTAVCIGDRLRRTKFAVYAKAREIGMQVVSERGRMSGEHRSQWGFIADHAADPDAVYDGRLYDEMRMKPMRQMSPIHDMERRAAI